MGTGLFGLRDGEIVTMVNLLDVLGMIGQEDPGVPEPYMKKRRFLEQKEVGAGPPGSQIQIGDATGTASLAPLERIGTRAEGYLKGSPEDDPTLKVFKELVLKNLPDAEKYAIDYPYKASQVPGRMLTELSMGADPESAAEAAWEASYTPREGIGNVADVLKSKVFREDILTDVGILGGYAPPGKPTQWGIRQLQKEFREASPLKGPEKPTKPEDDPNSPVLPPGSPDSTETLGGKDMDEMREFLDSLIKIEKEGGPSVRDQLVKMLGPRLGVRPDDLDEEITQLVRRLTEALDRKPGWPEVLIAFGMILTGQDGLRLIETMDQRWRGEVGALAGILQSTRALQERRQDRKFTREQLGLKADQKEDTRKFAQQGDRYKTQKSNLKYRIGKLESSIKRDTDLGIKPNESDIKMLQDAQKELSAVNQREQIYLQTDPYQGFTDEDIDSLRMEALKRAAEAGK